MNTRLQQFLSAENISQAQFADTIGVARASVSHILAGRNRPGFDFIERMARRYPSLNLEWLITGKGKMYKADTERVAPRLWEDDDVEQASPAVEADAIFSGPQAAETPPPTASITSIKHMQAPVKQRGISRIVVFYDDNTFQELK